MADFEFPSDLVELQKRFFEAEERIKEVNGEEFLAVLAAQQEIVLAKLRHPFWETVVGRRYQADMALRKCGPAGG